MLHTKDIASLAHSAGTVELKTLTDEGSFEGYASVFNVVDQGEDIVLPGAFTKTLKKRPASGVKMLLQHDWGNLVGVWDEIKEDEKGLYVKGHLLLDLHNAQQAHILLKAGALDAMSIGYRTVKSTRDDQNGPRKLVEVDLWEVSLVTFPMNPAAKVRGVKGEWNEREIEGYLREAGLPKEFAKNVVLHGVKRARELSGDRRDADNGTKELLGSLARAQQLFTSKG
jgi:HK97 family phage prohead protease